MSEQIDPIQSQKVPEFPATEAFKAWYDHEKSVGLVDVKFFKRNVDGATTESFFSEVISMLSAQEVEDKNIF